MKKSIVTIFFAMMLYSFCYGYHVVSSSVTNDSISAIYKGIPGNGIFNRWLLLGSIPICQDNQNSEDQALQKAAFDKDYILPSGSSQFVNTKKLFILNSYYQWQFVQEDNGIIDLTKRIVDNAFAITYAYARIDMPEEQEFILGAGSDDAIKIWVNGNLIHSNWAARGLLVDNDLIHIKFKKGRNDILVKIQNRGGSCAFTCRAILPEQYTEKLIFNTKIGQIENVKQLLKSGAEINSLSILGLTPLQTAFIYGQNKLVDLFLERGADSTMKMPPNEKIVDAYFNHIIKEYYPGAAVLISKDGRILYQKAYGYANLENDVPFKTDAKFRIGSVTKQFTAAAILKLQERGLLNVNDTVSKYIPELPRSSEVTIHELLTHTSGLQESWDEDLFKNVPVEFKTDDIIREIKKFKYVFNPGESWRYSNMGYIVLSIIIERISGSSYYNFLRENFFEQLGMINTGIPQRNDLFSCETLKNEATGYYYENSKIYKVFNLDRSSGAGAIYSTLEDLFKWNEAVFNNNVLSPGDLNMALTPVQTNDGSPGKYGFSYGYGWQISKLNGLKRIYHGGATDGYECSLNRYIDNNMNIIVFVNRFPFPPGINAGIVSEEIAGIYQWEEMKNGHKSE
ncbi:MAG: serine hydrolase [Bacteroidales bacterium]